MLKTVLTILPKNFWEKANNFTLDILNCTKRKWNFHKNCLCLDRWTTALRTRLPMFRLTDEPKRIEKRSPEDEFNFKTILCTGRMQFSEPYRKLFDNKWQQFCSNFEIITEIFFQKLSFFLVWSSGYVKSSFQYPARAFTLSQTAENFWLRFGKW